MTDLKLSIFKDLQSYESKAVDLDTVLWWIKSDQSVKDKTELYRNLARTITREEANKKVKNSIMPAFSVAVVFNGNGKQTTHVTRVTGLSICDIDHVEESQMETVRGKIWSDPHTVLAYTTISGEGFRVIFAYVGEQGSPRRMASSIGRRIRRATSIMPTSAAWNTTASAATSPASRAWPTTLRPVSTARQSLS